MALYETENTKLNLKAKRIDILQWNIVQELFTQDIQ